MTEKTLFDEMVIEKPLEKFHNTTNETGEQLKQRQIRAGSQNRKVLDFFKSHSYQNFTPFEVWKWLGINNQPITSIRRAMSDLTNMDYLVRTNIKRMGQWNEPCFAWQLK